MKLSILNIVIVGAAYIIGGILLTNSQWEYANKEGNYLGLILPTLVLIGLVSYQWSYKTKS